MRRDQLEHAIRAACQIAGLTEVIIVGSRSAAYRNRTALNFDRDLDEQ